MNDFDIQPFVGALPIKFGMSPDEVHQCLGMGPVRAFTNQDKELRENYGGVQVFYDKKSRVREVSFVPGSATVLFRGEPLLGRNATNPLEVLSRCDSEPREHLGFVVFFQAGVTVTGYHDGDVAQRSVVAFRKGLWDKFRAKAKKVRLNV